MGLLIFRESTQTVACTARTLYSDIGKNPNLANTFKPSWDLR